MEEAGADLGLENDNGCSVAHWAASGGDEAVCRCVYFFCARDVFVTVVDSSCVAHP